MLPLNWLDNVSIATIPAENTIQGGDILTLWLNYFRHIPLQLAWFYLESFAIGVQNAAM
jgi:hypothetical protein